MRRRPFEPAEVAWCVILSEAAVVDLALLRLGHLPLSTVCRRSLLGRTLVLALGVHLLASLRFDPLTLLGRRLSPVQKNAGQVLL